MSNTAPNRFRFRCWWKTGKVMVYPGRSPAWYINPRTGAIAHPLQDYKTSPEEEAYFDGGLQDRKDCIPLQSTGMVDKKGVEIFEGDIVRVYRHHNGPYRYTGSVVWDEPVMCVTSPHNESMLVDGDILEVVGSVYENPELLK